MKKGLAVSVLLGLNLGAAIASTLSSAAEFGPWYGAFRTGIGATDISIDLDQLANSRTGAAAIAFIPTGRPDECPRDAHPAFCKELADRVQQGDPDAFDNQVLGVLYEGDKEAFIAFGFSDEETVRMLAVKRSGRDAPFAAVRFYHPLRGVDAEVNSKPDSHLCEQAQCFSDRLRELARNGDAAIGLLQNPKFFGTFDLNKDGRADAHARWLSSVPAPKDNGFGVYQSVGQFMTAIWQVEDDGGTGIGELRIFATGTRSWGGFGELDDNTHAGKRSKVKLDESGRSQAGVDFDLTFAASGGEELSGELVIDLPQSPKGRITGLLTHAGRQTSVSLKRLGAYEGEFEDSGDYESSGSEGFDHFFHLRNVPEGRSLVLRQGPSRKSKALAGLMWTTTGLSIEQCTPDIASEVFNLSSHDEKLELLGGAWCQVTTANTQIPSGYVLGRYLQPSE
ncbi:MAG: hypothetical protein ABJQ71_18320 [Roseibium sp.]